MTQHSQKLNRKFFSKNKEIISWALFDFANSSFSIVVVTFIFAVYFKNVVCQKMYIGDLYWSFGTAISMLVTAFVAPVMGAIADYSAGKKRFLLSFTLVCIICTSLLFFVKKGDIALGLTLFVFANIGFELGLVFYDSFLPEITEPKNFGRVSGYGYALGYIGSLASLCISYYFIVTKQINLIFPISGLFFFIFILPLFLNIKDTRKKVEIKTSPVIIGLKRVVYTIRNLKQYKNLSVFLLAYFFFIEGVNTVIFFSGNYAASTLKFSDYELMIFFIVTQTTAILGAIIFGIISDSIGTRKTIMLSLIIWIGTILLAYFKADKSTFYVVGLLAGSVMGATQSVSRSMMSKLTPHEKETEFFGFYSFFGKSSAVFGPLVFGFVSYTTSNQRLSILSMLFFFTVGLTILFFVKDDHQKS